MKLQLGSKGDAAMSRQSDWESQKRIPMFTEKDLYPTFLKQNGGPYTCIILPGFNHLLSPHDQARATSYEPYRDAVDLMDESQKEEGDFYPHKAFTGWYAAVYGYAYYGKAWSSFVSPGTPSDYFSGDPIQEIRQYVRKLDKDGDNTYSSLLKGNPNNNEICWLPNVANMMIMNIWGGSTNPKSKDQDVKNRILVLRNMSVDKLRHDLAQQRPVAIQTPVDPDYPDYMFGDPTNPARAILCKKVAYSTTMTNGMSMTAAALSLGDMIVVGGRPQIQVQHQTISPEMLAGRYELDQVIHVPSYEEIVDLLVEEQGVPYDLIQRVCAPKYNGTFPSNPAVTNVVKAASTPQPQTPVSQHVPPAPYANIIDPDDDIPGLESSSKVPSSVMPKVLEEVDDTPPVFNNGDYRTKEEEEELARLQAMVLSRDTNATIEQYQRFAELNRKKPFQA